jgi:hypothetical protein
MILFPLLAVVLKRLGFAPNIRVKRPMLVVAGVLVFPAVIINAGLIALAWNRFWLHHKPNARRLGLRGCIAFGVLLLLLEAAIVSIL